MLEFWQGLTDLQQTLLIAGVILGGLGILWAFVARGADFSGFGDWLRSWFE